MLPCTCSFRRCSTKRSTTEDAYTKSLKLSQGNQTVELGVAYYRARNWRKAIESLEKSIGISGSVSFSYNAFFLAMAHWQLGEMEEARRWYDKAVEWMEERSREDEELVRFRAEAEELLGITDEATANNETKTE